MVSRQPPPPCVMLANPGEMAVRRCSHFESSWGACGFNNFPAQGLPHYRPLQEAAIGPCLHKWLRIRDVTLHPLCGPAPPIHWRVLVALVAGMSSMMRTDFLSLGKEELYRLQDRLRPTRRSVRQVAWSPRQRTSSSSRREQEPEVWKVIDECGEDDDTQGQ